MLLGCIASLEGKPHPEIGRVSGPHVVRREAGAEP
jgi:hypothetical protein